MQHWSDIENMMKSEEQLRKDDVIQLIKKILDLKSAESKKRVKVIYDGKKYNHVD